MSLLDRYKSSEKKIEIFITCFYPNRNTVNFVKQKLTFPTQKGFNW